MQLKSIDRHLDLGCHDSFLLLSFFFFIIKSKQEKKFDIILFTTIDIHAKQKQKKRKLRQSRY